MADKSFIDTPADMIATPPASKKGGPGTYDGETGYPSRTHSPNGVPEKVRDGSVPKVDKTVTTADKFPKNM